MLGLSTGETESILCGASVLAFMANHGLQRLFSILTKETEFSNFCQISTFGGFIV